MALTPQVVEDWIKENVCADKDKSTSKKDIWSSFHAGCPSFLSKSVTALNKHAVMEWATAKLAPGTQDNILTKDEVWNFFKIHNGISDERHHERFLGLFRIAAVGQGLFSSVSIKKKKTFVGLKVNEPSKDKCPAQAQRGKNVDCMSGESKTHSEDRSGDSKSTKEEVDAKISDGDINIEVDDKENILENVERNDGMSDYENESSCSHEDLSTENMSSSRESEGEDDTSTVIIGEERDQLKLEHSSARQAPDECVSDIQTQESLFRRFHRKLNGLMPFHFPCVHSRRSQL